MAKHRTRVGLHARNDLRFPEHDFELVRLAGIETLKMMSFTDVSVYRRLRQEHPTIEFIVRLYDDRFGRGSRPSPAEFVARMVPVIMRLKPYTAKFEIHNEPNHVDGIEGWSPGDDAARSFRDWYMQVLRGLKKACPWAQFGFPGLALNHPHRDLEWLEICSDAVQAADWLGCHCYWQYDNMLADEWGLRFKLYHERFPTKRIEITEFGNSTPNLPAEKIAQEYVRYYQELNRYLYLGSASAFIASSPDPNWAPFAWVREGGNMLPVVQAVGAMPRTPVDVPEPKPPKPAKEPVAVPERTFPQTGKTVRGSFLQFFNRYGLDICGYPITDQLQEEGKPVQYFQRVALEEAAPGKIRLKAVGTEAWTSRQEIERLAGHIEALLERRLSASALPPPDTVDLVDELATHPTKRFATRSLADITQIVIHHTATGPTVTPQRLAQYLVDNFDLPGILYHYFVAGNGTIYRTNRLETAPEHAQQRSQNSIGICFAGNFTARIPTAAQLRAGGQLCAWLLESFCLPADRIQGASEFATTQSPGLQWLEGQRWKDRLLAEVNAASSQEEPVAGLPSYRGADTTTLADLPPPGSISKPPIQDMVEKLIRHPTKRYPTRPLTQIKTLVVHHSAVPASVGPQQIANYHVNKLGWAGIGYHFLISANGVIYQGNQLAAICRHVSAANETSVGICFLGDLTSQAPPPAQLKAGAHLLAWLLQELRIPLDQIKGHRELMQTTCPGNHWLQGKQWKKTLREEIVRLQEQAVPPAPGPKTIFHYMLFWARNGLWAEQDWLNAVEYIAGFRPTAGFTASDAAQAKYVTIVGSPAGVPPHVAEWLRVQGCKVERIAGKDEEETRQMLNTLVRQGRRFRTFDPPANQEPVPPTLQEGATTEPVEDLDTSEVEAMKDDMMVDSMQPGYQVSLPVFEGPLDLLLHLIERQELDITEVSLAQVTNQYVEYTTRLGERNPDSLADFLVVAAKLLLIKSRVLLPQATPSLKPDKDETGEDLVRQLLEYKKFKEAAHTLGDLESQGLHSFIRLGAPPRLDAAVDLEGVSVDDLLAAVRQALAIKPAIPSVDSTVSPVTITVADQMHLIEQETASGQPVSFGRLLERLSSRLEIIVTLLALLELIKQKRVAIRQEQPFADIEILKMEPSPAAKPA